MKAVHRPCGEVIEAETDDELVDKTQQHVRDDHPELEAEYTREDPLDSPRSLNARTDRHLRLSSAKLAVTFATSRTLGMPR